MCVYLCVNASMCAARGYRVFNAKFFSIGNRDEVPWSARMPDAKETLKEAQSSIVYF